MLVITFPVPLMVIIPALAIKEPLTLISPITVAILVVVTTPVTARLLSTILLPVIVLVVPVMVKIPGEGCVNAPEPEVNKFPEILIVVIEGAVIFDPVIERL